MYDSASFGASVFVEQRRRQSPVAVERRALDLAEPKSGLGLGLVLALPLWLALVGILVALVR